jgi:hypothetical protein
VELLQGFNRELKSAYAHTPSSSDKDRFPHLNSKGKKGRRRALLKAPSDRAALVAETKELGHGHRYAQLEAELDAELDTGLDGESLAKPSETYPLGRIQNPTRPALWKEQHYYDAGGSFTPYPREAEHLESLAADGKSTKDVWQALDAVNRGQRPSEAFRAHEQSLMSVPTITNISEVQRSPLMGAGANLEMANQAHALGEAASFQSAFGYTEERERPSRIKASSSATKKKAKPSRKPKPLLVNLPGSIHSTGSGAVHQFEAVEKAIESGDISDAAVRREVKRAHRGSNVAEARDLAVGKKDALLKTFGDRLQMTDISKAQEIEGDGGRETATLMRLQSGLRRNTMRQMGLLPYSLRTLAKRESDASASKHELPVPGSSSSEEAVEGETEMSEEE